MGGQIKVQDTENDEEIFGCTYGALEELKGIFIRAAITYLENLSRENISRQLLVDEGILDAHSAEHEDEVVVITNYRLRIDAALKLLRSWCREQTGDGESNIGRPTQTEDIRSLLARRRFSYERPISDSILGQNFPLELMGAVEDMNMNYRVDKIPKTLPPVLDELNLQGLHHYAAHGREISYEEAQQIIAFLDKVKPYLEFPEPDWETEEGPIDEQLRTVFAGCKRGGKVTID